MSILIELVFEKGWKENENNRFGYALVVQFKEKASGKILFRYAPYLKDKEFWAYCFNSIYSLDDLHKEYIDKIKSMGIRFSGPIKKDLGVCEQ